MFLLNTGSSYRISFVFMVLTSRKPSMSHSWCIAYCHSFSLYEPSLPINSYICRKVLICAKNMFIFLGIFSIRTDQQLLLFGWVGRRFHNTTQRNLELPWLHWWKKKCWFMFLTGRGVGVGMRTSWKLSALKRTGAGLDLGYGKVLTTIILLFVCSIEGQKLWKDKGLSLRSLEAKIRVTFWSA